MGNVGRSRKPIPWPVIDSKGLMRIKSYVGTLPWVASLHEAADVLRQLFAGQFPNLSNDDWVAFARRICAHRFTTDYGLSV